MGRIFTGFVIGIVLISALTTMPVPGASAAVRVGGLGTHHLLSDPKARAFVFGLRGGFAAGGPFVITIYANGTVRLQKAAGGTTRLLSPHRKVFAVGMRALLHFAEVEHFFSMPATFGRSKADIPTTFITINTAETSKTVKVLDASVPGFDELYTLLYYVAGGSD